MGKNGAIAVFLTLLAGTLGGLAAEWVGVPAGSLLGASVAVAALVGVTGIGRMPPLLRDMGFATIGVSLGGGIDADMAQRLPDWALSLGLLILSLIVTIWIGALALQRVLGIDRDTAVLATAPGTMSNVIAMAVEGRGDVGTITSLQVVRLLFMVLMVPPFATLIDADTSAVTLVQAPMGLQPLAVLMVSGLAVGLTGKKLGIPASCFMFGLLISAVAHAGELVHGAAPPWAMFFGLMIAGAALGTNINGLISGISLRMLMRAGGLMLAMALLVSMLFAVVTAVLTGLPVAQVWIAFAPGGVEVMAAIGLSLGFDPAFIALHHFARILALVVLVPLALGRNRGAGRQALQ